MWSTEHPIAFVFMAGTVATSVGYLVAGQQCPLLWHMPAPDLKADFDVAAYAGVPWAVQATLVALVYPIVLSFIALLLQRKAQSTVALRAYVLDCAVVPAGSSSIGLMVLMGVEFFSIPYGSSSVLAKYLAPLLVLNGAWLLINILLTGFFLSRTIRFLQEEEQRHVFTRVAVDIALSSELTSAVKQHILVNAAQTDWGFSADSEVSSEEPQVLMFSLHEGQPQVVRSNRSNLVLDDVHLRLLSLVVRGWCRRAAQGRKNLHGQAPELIFPSRIGEVVTGETVLCAVHNGPPLNRWERALVKAAFLYRSSRQGMLSLSTRKMLEEIGAEVEAAADLERFGTAEERLKDVIALHKTLLLASAISAKGAAENAATIGASPYSWGESSFDIEWLKPYRDIGRIAVNWLDVDARLFRRLAIVPASIVASLPPRPDKLLIDAQLVGTNLAYQLAGWWTRKADESLSPGATTFSGTLPSPLSKVYEQAVISFIGSWGHLRVDVSEEKGDDAEVWLALVSAARVYARHIENSASLFLKAVSRGDETGASRLLDSFLKWWGNRLSDFECADIEDDFRVRHVTMTLVEKNWAQAQSFLWDGSEDITIEFARQALHLAIRRYWESMRLCLVLLLIENAGLSPASNSRELRYAAALVKGSPLFGGGKVEASPLDSIDAVLRGVLGEVHGVETAIQRIDRFSEQLSWENEAPEVSGWLYSWSGSPTDLDSKRRALIVLLVSVSSAGRPLVRQSKKLVESWWKDIGKLESVSQHLRDLRREVLASSFAQSNAVVAAFQTQLHNNCKIRTGQLGVARAMRQLSRVAQFERRLTLHVFPVDEEKIREFRKRIAATAFDAARLPPPVAALHFVPDGFSARRNTTVEDNKKRYLVSIGAGADPHLAQNVGEWVGQRSVALAFYKTVTSKGLQPVNSPGLRSNYEASHADMQAYVSAVSARCATLRAQGEQPLVLVGRSAAEVYLRPYKWGSERWQCALPPNISIRKADDGSGTSFINDTPVFEFPTPNADCYVVPASWIKSLAVEGSNIESAISIQWRQIAEDRLEFTVSWAAEFR